MVAIAGSKQSVILDLTGLRIAGVVMLVTAAALPILPRQFSIACPLRTITGVPCPFCGMTTSVTAVVHGDLSQAFHVNPFGILAVVVAVLLVVLYRVRTARMPAIFIVAALGASWAIQLNRFGWI